VIDRRAVVSCGELRESIARSSPRSAVLTSAKMLAGTAKAK
jgi:hypothetical protein